MLVETDRDQTLAMLGAMRQVAITGGRNRLTGMAHRMSASRLRFHQSGCRAEQLPSNTAHRLKGALVSDMQGMWAVRFLAVTALADAVLDKRYHLSPGEAV